MPIFLSDIPGLFTGGRVPLDAALLQLSPPDAHGLCTLGTSVEAARAAADTAGMLLAEINVQMPRTHGNAFVPFERIKAFTVTDRPLIEHAVGPENAVEGAIGALVAGLVEDGSTLQAGIGGIPNAALRRLTHKRDLGIHTEMFSDGMLDLWEAGAITNRHKATSAGRITTSFVTGTRRLFDFVDDNPQVEFLPCDRTNDTLVIHRNPKVVAINSALSIDLTGQVCADSLGHRIYSGIGGQMDFMRGAARSAGGKPIIALPSTASSGKVSRIVPTVDRSKATLLVKVSFKEKDARVLPDMSSKVAFLSRDPKPQERKPVTAVRPEAVVTRDGKSVVFLIGDKNVVKEVAVGKPERLGDLVQVSGVKSGDKVVLSPPERVKDGASVALAKK